MPSSISASCNPSPATSSSPESPNQQGPAPASVHILRLLSAPLPHLYRRPRAPPVVFPTDSSPRPPAPSGCHRHHCPCADSPPPKPAPSATTDFLSSRSLSVFPGLHP